MEKLTKEYNGLDGKISITFEGDSVEHVNTMKELIEERLKVIEVENSTK